MAQGIWNPPPPTVLMRTINGDIVEMPRSILGDVSRRDKKDYVVIRKKVKRL